MNYLFHEFLFAIVMLNSAVFGGNTSSGLEKSRYPSLEQRRNKVRDNEYVQVTFKHAPPQATSSLTSSSSSAAISNTNRNARDRERMPSFRQNSLRSLVTNNHRRVSQSQLYENFPIPTPAPRDSINRRKQPVYQNVNQHYERISTYRTGTPERRMIANSNVRV